MSIFQVQLTNVNQGTLDAVGQSTGTSIQRTARIWGPDLKQHILSDGDTFEGSAFWKQYVYGGSAAPTLEDAILIVVSDDGTDYIPGDRTYLQPYSYMNTEVPDGEDFGDTVTLDILTDAGGVANYVQILSDHDITVRFNGDENSDLDITANVAQIFNKDEIQVSTITFANASGSTATVDVFVTVRKKVQ